MYIPRIRQDLVDIYNFIVRLDWEGSLSRGSSALQRLEEERLTQLSSKAKQYLAVMKENR